MAIFPEKNHPLPTEIEIRPKRPGDILRDLMRDRRLSQTDLATIIGRPRQAVCETINGRRQITVQMAKALAVVFGDDPMWGSAFSWLRARDARRLHDLERATASK